MCARTSEFQKTETAWTCMFVGGEKENAIKSTNPLVKQTVTSFSGAIFEELQKGAQL